MNWKLLLPTLNVQRKNDVLIRASEMGHDEQVKVQLADDRVASSDDDWAAFVGRWRRGISMWLNCFLLTVV